MTITTSNERGQTIELYKQGDNTAYDKHATYTIFLASGVNWRFHAWGPSVSGYTLTLDDYREFPASQKYVPDEHQTFTYDELDRLKTASKTFADGYIASYTYDAIGNLKTKTEDSVPVITYTYPALTRPHAATALTTGSVYTYNVNGDMTTRIEVSGTQRITYTQAFDSENRLGVVTKTITTTPNIVTKFYYNGDGARLKKTEQLNTGPVLTTTFYAGALEVLSTTQLITKTYYSAGGQMIAMREVTNTTGAGKLYYLHSDHLGSTSVTTCGNSACGTVGAVLTRQSYYPYGGVRVAGNLPTDHTFTGQLEDDGTGLMQFRARYLSPSLGRFISADMIVPGAGNPQAFNRYSYVLNSPLNYIDPTGHVYDDWADCDNANSSGTYDTSNGAMSQADCWKYNEEKNLLEIAGVTGDVLSEANRDIAGLLAALTRGFGMKFAGKWAWGEARVTTQAIVQTARAFGRSLGDYTRGADAFKAVYTSGLGPATMRIVKNGCILACVLPNNEIHISTQTFSSGNALNIVIHELGHKFDFKVHARWHLDDQMLARYGFDPDLALTTDGFLPGTAIYGGGYRNTRGVEQWADMFLGYVIGGFDLTTNEGQLRFDFMQSEMTKWLQLFTTPWVIK